MYIVREGSVIKKQIAVVYLDKENVVWLLPSNMVALYSAGQKILGIFYLWRKNKAQLDV